MIRFINITLPSFLGLLWAVILFGVTLLTIGFNAFVNVIGSPLHWLLESPMYVWDWWCTRYYNLLIPVEAWVRPAYSLSGGHSGHSISPSSHLEGFQPYHG